MTTRIALFRGINVGGHNKIRMADLVSLMESLGLDNVRSYIQSGNVVFMSRNGNIPGLSGMIQDAVETQHGFRPNLIILDAAQLDRAITANPYPEADAQPNTLHLAFLADSPRSPNLEKLEQVQRPDERFKLIDRVFYLHAPGGIARSKLAAQVERALGVTSTSRNWRTVLKLQEMVNRPTH